MIGYRRSSNKLIVSTSWLSMCYSSKSSAGTWLLHFNSSLAKLTIYYSMCWLRSEKMNWLLIRVALRGHRGETTHSPAISVNGGPFSDWDNQGRPRSLSLIEKNLWIRWKQRPQTWPSSCSVRQRTREYNVEQLQFHLMTLVRSVDRMAAACGTMFDSMSFVNKSLTSEGLWIRKLWRKYLTGRDDLWGILLFGSLFLRSLWISPFITIN